MFWNNKNALKKVFMKRMSDIRFDGKPAIPREMLSETYDFSLHGFAESTEDDEYLSLTAKYGMNFELDFSTSGSKIEELTKLHNVFAVFEEMRKNFKGNYIVLDTSVESFGEHSEPDVSTYLGLARGLSGLKGYLNTLIGRVFYCYDNNCKFTLRTCLLPKSFFKIATFDKRIYRSLLDSLEQFKEMAITESGLSNAPKETADYFAYANLYTILYDRLAYDYNGNYWKNVMEGKDDVHFSKGLMAGSVVSVDVQSELVVHTVSSEKLGIIEPAYSFVMSALINYQLLMETVQDVLQSGVRFGAISFGMDGSGENIVKCEYDLDKGVYTLFESALKELPMISKKIYNEHGKVDKDNESVE